MTTTTLEVLARHLDVGDKAAVDLGAGITMREVIDVRLLNHGRSGVLVTFDAPEAPRGTLTVTLPRNTVVMVEPGDPRAHAVVQHGNLREYLAMRGNGGA